MNKTNFLVLQEIIIDKIENLTKKKLVYLVSVTMRPFYAGVFQHYSSYRGRDYILNSVVCILIEQSETFCRRDVTRIFSYGISFTRKQG